MIDRRPLVLETAGEVVVGDPVAFRVRDWHKPVEGVRVVSHTDTAVTDRTGRCELTFRAPGFWKVAAFKPADDYVAYEPATALVHAVTEAASRGRLPGIATDVR
ncbi:MULTISPECIES: carboxypeptidase regulatory-like domain-containing protein [Saliphagus]|uniref:Carboxypeptidase regulatory-like domain-containing protein n=1 Tax=Saliphagus infecundisoli TaxID=1849069 RepID=A0ABD5QF15_9EURY|nr:MULTISPECIES: carboxypeptidase regulatory-like domain-containing protein [Saliphagus]